MISTQHWVGVWLKHLHLQKQTPDFEVLPFALYSGEGFPQCIHSSHQNIADLRGHPLLSIIQPKAIESQTLIFISFLEGNTDPHTLAPLFPPAHPHIADGISHRGGSTTFHGCKVRMPCQATLHLKHAYPQPRDTWHHERQLGNLLHQTPIDFFAASFSFWRSWRHKCCLQ